MWLPSLILLVEILGILTAIKALMEVRTAQGTVAWVVLLVTMPYVAVPAYWVFGRSKFKGYVNARRKHLMATSGVAREFLRQLRSQNLIGFPERDGPMIHEKLALLPITQGNDAELLVDGEATFASIFAGIDRAREYVLVQFYIIHDDEVGRELQRRLIARAKQGTRCFLLYDEIGSHDLPDRYVNELRTAGVNVRPFHTTRGRRNRFQINFRNHRKIVVVDGREAWVGGLNVGDEYLGRNPNFGRWRDTHVRLVGPVVQCVQVPFLEDWHWATGEKPSLEWTPQPAPGGKSRPVLCVPTGPADILETGTLFFLNMINRAQKRLWIASPYFVPDEQFLSALQLAALRDVDVRILVPDKCDNFLVQLAAWSYLETLDIRGIKVFRYTAGFMHHKVVVVDDYCTIGTANFDNRSFRLNFEITIGFGDAEFTSQVVAMLERDFSNAREVKATDFQKRSFWFRLAARAARLTAPIQ